MFQDHAFISGRSPAPEGYAVRMAKARKKKPLPIKTPPDPELHAPNPRRPGAFHRRDPAHRHRRRGALLRSHYVDRTLAAVKDPPHVVLKNQPVWMTDFLAEQIAKCAQPAGTHSVFDHNLLVSTRDLLKANPGFRTSDRSAASTAKSPGDTLESTAITAPPSRWSTGKTTTGSSTEAASSSPKPSARNSSAESCSARINNINIRVVEGVRQPPPESGARWQGEDVKAAIDLVKLLYAKPYANEIMRVDCNNYAGRRDPKASQLVLITNKNTEVRWGRPSAPATIISSKSPPRKNSNTCRRSTTTSTTSTPTAWVDLRFDTITRPAAASPQTANARLPQ